MPLNNRDYVREEHPPACTCTKCVDRRLRGLRKEVHPSYVSTCPICYKKSLWHNVRGGIYECLNLDCKAIGRSPTSMVSPLNKLPKKVPKGLIFFLAVFSLACIGFGAYYLSGESNIPKMAEVAPPETTTIQPPTITITPPTIPEAPTVKPTPPPALPTLIPKIGEFNSGTGEYKNFYLGLVYDISVIGGSNCYGEFITLINNKESKNLSYSQLLNFLKTDKTDEFPYKLTFPMVRFYYGEAEDKIDLEYIKSIIDKKAAPMPPKVCADFAERLHNNAELSGIRCGYVSLEMDDGMGHACNIFETTDEGIVYIDVTGSPGGYGPLDSDTIVTIEVGKEYNPKFLFPSEGWYVLSGGMGVVTRVSITWDGSWRE